MLRHNQILPSISGLKNNQWVSQVKVKSPVSLQGPTSSSLHFSVFMPIPSPPSSLCSILLLLSQQPDKYSLKAFMLAVFSAQYSLKQWHVLLISQFLEVVTKEYRLGQIYAGHYSELKPQTIIFPFYFFTSHLLPADRLIFSHIFYVSSPLSKRM